MSASQPTGAASGHSAAGGQRLQRWSGVAGRVAGTPALHFGPTLRLRKVLEATWLQVDRAQISRSKGWIAAAATAAAAAAPAHESALPPVQLVLLARCACACCHSPLTMQRRDIVPAGEVPRSSGSAPADCRQGSTEPEPAPVGSSDRCASPSAAGQQFVRIIPSRAELARQLDACIDPSAEDEEVRGKASWHPGSHAVQVRRCVPDPWLVHLSRALKPILRKCVFGDPWLERSSACVRACPAASPASKVAGFHGQCRMCLSPSSYPGRCLVQSS